MNGLLNTIVQMWRMDVHILVIIYELNGINHSTIMKVMLPTNAS